MAQGDYLCKLDLKDACFCVSWNKQSKKYVRSEWKGSLYEFICLCFGVGPDPKFFTNWSQAEQALDTNIVELRPAKFMIFTFSRYKKDLVAHVRMEKKSSISLFGNNGGTRNLLMIQEAKEIWELCFAFFKYKGRQGLQGNEKLVKRMDIKQANVDVNLFECKLSNHTQRYISW